MNKKRVVLAMSGGVDSSVAAYLLKKRGFSVIGITFKVWPKGVCMKQDKKSCCSLDAINDARQACREFDIPHYVIDCEKEFKKLVIDSFLDSYKKGLTPNPCIVCNERIKFPLLLKKAKELQSYYIATGHHGRVGKNRINKRFLIKEAKDKNKDQSYVLFGLNQNILQRLLLPVGNHRKPEIKLLAKRLKLRSTKRQESQEICFVENNKLPAFLKSNLPDKIKPGLIKNKDGKILGKHNGLCLYTIGQRRGLKIPYARPLYVIDTDCEKNEIIVGEKKETLKKSITVKGINWLVSLPNNKKQLLSYVKIRYKHTKQKAILNILSNNSCQVDFYNPQSAPTPGQAAVFYQRNSVIGGGWITKVGI